MMKMFMGFRLKTWFLLFGVCLLLIGSYLYTRPIPQLTASTVSFSSPAKPVSLPWPTYGQGALAEKDFGLLATHGEQKAVPMASTAKIVTALAVIKQKPLKTGEQGPIITIDQVDVDSYNSYYSRGGAVAKVVAGEQISQYQALQAMLIPSANNFAGTLARWAFGSIENYVQYANQMLADMKLKNTKVADASGFSPNSVSSADELVSLGKALMESPVLAEVVSQQTAEIAVAGKVNNINWLLGSDGVVGIKTGSTDEAGGCFVFAAKRQILGQDMTFIGAVMAAPNRNQAISDSRTVLRSLEANFEQRIITKKGQVVGGLSAAWDASADIVVADDFKVVAWKGASLDAKNQINGIKAPMSAGSTVGQMKVTLGINDVTTPLILKDSLETPPWHWRLFR